MHVVAHLCQDKAQYNILQVTLDGMSFSCGTPLQELNLPYYNVFIVA